MTKEIVLAMLKGQKDFISGEKISEKIGVSRMAVSAAVKQLREEGYDITSVTRRGYKLNQSPDHLSRGELLPLLGKDRMLQVICLETVDSTNKYLRELTLKGEAADGTVVVANEQTSGKGRKHTSFSSPKNKGIYLSMRLVDPVSGTEEMGALSEKIAEAVACAVEEVTGVKPERIGAGDLYINGKKICGMLSEMSVEAETMSIEDVILGVGLRVHHEEKDFSEEMRQQQSSLYREIGKHFSRAELTAAMIREMDKIHRNC